MKNATLTATSSLSLPVDSYIYKILPIDAKIAAILSDDSLRIVDPNTLQEISDYVIYNVHQGATCLEKYDSDDSGVFTAGRDGVVRYWDLRTRGKAIEFCDGESMGLLIP